MGYIDQIIDYIQTLLGPLPSPGGYSKSRTAIPDGS